MRKVRVFKDAHGTVMKGTKPIFFMGDFWEDYLFPPSLERKSFLHLGDIYYRWFFWKPTLVVVDHGAINKILTDTDVYRKSSQNFQPFTDGAELEQQSETIKAVFNPKNMEILEKSVGSMAGNLMDQLVDSQGNGISFSVHETCLDYTREVMGALLYGSTFSACQIITAQRELSEISPLRAFIRAGFPSVAKLAPALFGIEQAAELSSGLTTLIADPSPDTVLSFLSAHRKLKEQGEKKHVDDDKEEREVEKQEAKFEDDRGIRHRKKENDEDHRCQGYGSSENHVTNLRMKQSMSNIIAFYTTGIDTTASVLTSTLFMLMRHQDVQENLRAEIIKASVGEELSYAKLKDIKMLTNVINETLRLHPPYPILYPRFSRKSDRLAGYYIPSKTNIIIDVVGHNRHPAYWSKPDVFDPSRFEQNPAASKYVLVWGKGPQKKVARSLGMLVLRGTIATLLLRYRIIPDPFAHPLDSSTSEHLAGVKFERSVASLRPKPALIGRITAIPAS